VAGHGLGASKSPFVGEVDTNFFDRGCIWLATAWELQSPGLWTGRHKLCTESVCGWPRPGSFKIPVCWRGRHKLFLPRGYLVGQGLGASKSRFVKRQAQTFCTEGVFGWPRLGSFKVPVCWRGRHKLFVLRVHSVGQGKAWELQSPGLLGTAWELRSLGCWRGRHKLFALRVHSVGQGKAW
jgi:hypothetical protein